jgi:hypothetical protein
MNLEKPLLAPLWSESFSFSKCHAEKKTPQDPLMPHIFDGIEFNKFARLWTRGYDVYTPSRTIVAHDDHEVMGKSAPALNGKGPVNPLEWSHFGMSPEFAREQFEKGLHRAKTLLGMPDGEKEAQGVSLLTRYGLGTKRTLDQLIEFTGIDTRNKKVFGDRCKSLEWVPFTPDAGTGYGPWATGRVCLFHIPTR